ncbi:ATP-binding protein [Nibricoccus sp. IMCC34717]|uniref:PAS domain-containing hybrid sensor histidine kinase/response regulator n=1 Tax=Nibricoccus sp. IMCC34717 TaxID=3034021 RepID=UPI00384F5259
MDAEAFLQTLAAPEDQLRLLLAAHEQSPVSVVITDTCGRIVYANPHVSRATGYQQEELLGRNVRVMRSGRQPREFYAHLWETIKAGKVWRGEFHNRRKDGTLFWESASISPVRDDSGAITHYLAVKEDVTEQKEAQEKLRAAMEAADAASRAKDAFLANMSHELRTPLNAINGLVQTLLEQECLPEQRPSLELVRQAGQDLLAIIQDVLLFSGLQAGRVMVDLKASALLPIVSNAIRLLAETAQTKGLEFTYWIDPTLPAEIETDPLRLQQVLVNLLSNAVKFTEEGRVHLAVRKAQPVGHDHEIDFIVSDTGIGMGPEALQRLFQPFSQADASITRRFGGAGLGLAISRTLARSLGGDITVRTREGRGSAFTLSLVLPIDEDARRIFDSTDKALAGVDIAIAAPRAVTRRLLESLFSGAGARVLANADHFPEALPETALRFDASASPRVRVGVGSRDQLGAIGGGLRWPLSPDQILKPAVDIAANLRGAHSRKVNEPKLGQRIPLRILAADDIRTNLETLRIMLRHLGYNDVVLVDDGQKAVEAAATREFDLILLDLHMPRMDGITAGRVIRGAGGAGHRPLIVALTASTLQSDRDLCYLAGMDDYLTKPVVPAVIAAMIEKHFAVRPSGSTPPEVLKAKADAAQEVVPWLDQSQLEAIASSLGEEEGQRMIHALMDSLSRDIDALLIDIEAACKTRDQEKLATLVHGLKGAALTSGWLRLGRRCADELRALRAGEFDDWDKWPAELRELAAGSVAAWRGKLN